jgi:hypothetical protein
MKKNMAASGQVSCYPANGQQIMPIPPRNRNWVWFFVVLALLALAAVGISTAYNLRQQLRPDALENAQALWKEKGPASYVLEYTKTIGEPETFVVKVRHRRTVSVMLYPGDRVQGNGHSLEPRLFPYYGMDALFDDMARYLKMDAEPGAPRAMNRAVFDPQDGHLLDYVRSVSQTGQRVHIEVKRLDVD